MKNLKKIREQKGISQSDLAKKLNLVRSTICQYEKGNRYPDIDMLIKLADYFGTSIDYLVDRVNEPYAVSPPNPSDEYTDAEKRVIKAYRTLVPGMQDYILEMIEKLADVDTGENKGKKVNRA